MMKNLEIQRIIRKNCFTRFRNKLSKFMLTKYPIKDYKEEILDEINRIVFGTNTALHIEKVHTPEEEIYGKIWKGWLEIENTYLILLSIEIMIDNITVNKKNVPHYRILAYHYGNYFNEVYILRERLVMYQKIIFRIYNRNRKNDRLLDLQKAINLILKSFNNAIEVRGRHVHLQRIELKEVHELEMTDSYRSVIKDKLLEIAYRNKLKETKKQIINYMKYRNKEIFRILKLYFYFIENVVFNRNGIIIIPNNGLPNTRLQATWPRLKE